ncbi:MAG: hypothetical protein A2252_08980 [Elusimicrobia bacterium RIFOXYA2_FULL_39_19]|nr:MAG: hypothetical protein A2252_08980 [Elusimicrobia bacterium RIFOXYA2_FULL_39_19]
MLKKLKSIPKDTLLFLLAVSFIGFAGNVMDSTFNNFLNDRFSITSIQRALLEGPREIPGFLVMFVSALLFFMCNRRLAAFSQLLAAIGIFCIGTLSTDFNHMLLWLFIFSTGQHLFLPLMSDIGMELSKDGKTGKRLGQFQGANNFAAILGSFLMFIGFKYLNFDFTISFVIAAVGFLCASILLYMMQKNKPVPVKTKFILRKEYGLFYWLTVLYGTRKQLFLTFAPWVLVTIFHQKVQTIATLLTIGGVIGIVFKPALGHAIDKFGEKKIIAAEAILLIFVCMGYGFSSKIFSMDVALIITAICYIADQLLMSVGMARATYMRKIGRTPEEVSSTLTAATTIDHVFSISIAMLGGLIWSSLGFEYIFLMGACIAVVNFFSALKIKTG